MDKAPEHTPGPWTVSEPCATCINSPMGTIAALAFISNEADAHLMAAAPEGLKLAREFLEYAQSGASFNYPAGALQKLEQFIAKATGQEKNDG